MTARDLSPRARLALRFRRYGWAVAGYLPTPAEALFFAGEMLDFPGDHGPAVWGWGLAHAMLWESL